MGAVCPSCRRSGPVVQPVGHPGSIPPTHIVHRFVAYVRLGGIAAAVRRASIRDPAPGVAAHEAVVDQVGIRARVDCVIGIPRIPYRHPVDRDCMGMRQGKICEQQGDQRNGRETAEQVHGNVFK